MAQGVLSALTGGEQATLAALVQATIDANAAVIAAGYPAYSAYLATKEKEIIFNDKCQQIATLGAQLLAAVTLPAGLKREK